MPATPVIDALKVMRFAVAAALDPLTTASIHWKKAEGASLPYVVFQSQDGGGRGDAWLDELTWSGLVTVKAYAATQDTAETLMGAVAPGMNSLSYTGYNVRAEYKKPVDLPAEEGVWGAAHQWRIFVSRTT